MPLTSFTKCVCDKCKREEIFESWERARTSSWRQIELTPLGGARGLASASLSNKPEERQAVLCGDCVGGLGINATPPKPLMEM